MKNAMILSAVLTLFASIARAQTSGVFTIGRRYSNYATTIDDIGSPALRTGRQNAIGLVGGY